MTLLYSYSNVNFFLIQEENRRKETPKRKRSSKRNPIASEVLKMFKANITVFFVGSCQSRKQPGKNRFAVNHVNSGSILNMSLSL